jgi:two-component system chemotaxis sensor kinase CheA
MGARSQGYRAVVTVFRGMHTFKGMAAAMGFNHLTELAHRTETLLDVVRSDPGSAIARVAGPALSNR